MKPDSTPTQEQVVDEPKGMLTEKEIRRLSGRSGDRTNYISLVILILLGAVMLFPFVWMILTSLKTSDQINVLPPTFVPKPFTLEKYRYIFTNMNFGRYLFNSSWLAVAQIIGSILTSSMVAFAMAKLPFKGSKLLLSLMLATMMMPAQVTMIPTYFIWVQLDLVPSYWPLIIPAFLGGGALNIYLFLQNYRSMPNALFESALIDGAHPVRIFTKIYLPLSGPVIAAVTVFAFMGSWNNTLGPLLYLAREEQRTLVLALLVLQGHPDFKDFGLQMAGSALTIMPTVIVYIFAQRYFVEGIASAGVKG